VLYKVLFIPEIEITVRFFVLMPKLFEADPFIGQSFDVIDGISKCDSRDAVPNGGESYGTVDGHGTDGMFEAVRQIDIMKDKDAFLDIE